MVEFPNYALDLSEADFIDISNTIFDHKIELL